MYLSIIQSMHKKFLDLSWLAYEEGLPKTRPLLGAKSTPSCNWRNLLACRVLHASLVVGPTTCLIPALYLPVGITQAQVATPAETSTGGIAYIRAPCPYPHHCSVDNCNKAHPATTQPS